MCQDSNEVWRDVPGFDGDYQVSDQGRVRSFKYTKPRMLKIAVLPKGYCFVYLCKNGKPKNYYVHHLVLFAFVGPRPYGMECRHFPDSNRSNNWLTNVAWGTPQDNAADKIIHGTTGTGCRRFHCGEKVWWKAKLTEEKVRMMRAEWKSGNYRYCDFARRHGVCWQTAKDVVTGHTWKHLLEEAG